MMRYFLGMDVGSSKTHALIVDETGRCVGFGKAGSGNYQGVGYHGLETTLKDSLAAAQKMCGVEKADITAAGFGAAGCDFQSDWMSQLEIISTLELSCPVEVVNDGWNGLFAGATRGIGVNVTAGTSNNCRGRSPDGREGRIVGNGFMFGEYGGAIEMVMRGLQVVNYAWIRRIPPTALTKIFTEAFGAETELALMEGLSKGNYHLVHLMALKIIEAARAGDEAAREVLNWAGEELGWLAVAVARQIGMENDPVEVIQSGSVFEAGSLITDPMQKIVLKYCPQAKVIRLKGLPAVGSVILGMERVGFDGYAVRETMIRTASELLKSYFPPKWARFQS